MNTTLQGALHNLHPDSASNPEYARGVLVGAVAATPGEFKMALAHVALHMPSKVMIAAVPPSWVNDLKRLSITLV